MIVRIFLATYFEISMLFSNEEKSKVRDSGPGPPARPGPAAPSSAEPGPGPVVAGALPRRAAAGPSWYLGPPWQVGWRVAASWIIQPADPATWAGTG